MKNLIFRIIKIVGTLFAFFNALMFYAMRPCWSGISSVIGYKGGDNTILYYLPVIICVLLFVILLSDLILKKIFDKNWLYITFLAISIAFFVVVLVIIKMGAIDYMRFVWPKFFVSLIYLAVILFLYYLLFIYPKTPLSENKIFKYGILSLGTLLAVLVLLNFSVNRITYQPVVYAVEDNYQIVYATNSEATAWVEIGGENYYDTYNGSSKKFTKIHKIEVPMNVLDTNKKYTVHTQRSIYCGPFGGFMGRDISKTINFKPVDTTDGIQYLAFSDVHMNDWQTGLFL